MTHPNPKQVISKKKDLDRRLNGFAGALAISALISGCTGSTYSSHFDCPMGEGAGCASISKVNKMLDRGAIDLGNDEVTTAKSDCEGTCSHQSARQALRLRSGLPSAKAEGQAYVYYGPGQLGRLISLDNDET